MKVGIDLGAHYRHQDHEKLGQVFHLVHFKSPNCIFYSFTNFNLQVRRSFPYLTTERFPHNWAIADMVKGYVAGTRKEHHRQAREDREGRDNSVTIKKTTRSNDASESELSPRIKSSSGSGSKSSKRRRDHDDDETSDLEDDQPSQTSKKTGSSASRPKPKKRRSIDSDIHAASEPEFEDVPSQANRQKIARPSSGPKLKKRHSGDSNSDIYATSEPEDAPSTKKRIQRSRPSTKLASSKDAPTQRSTRHVRKDSESVLTPGEYEPLCDSHGNDDDDDHDDDDHENDDDYDHGHENKFDGSNQNNFDNMDENDDLDFECAPPMKMASQSSRPSSQTKHIDDEDD